MLPSLLLFLGTLVGVDEPKSTKILLIAGPPSAKSGEHEYIAGCRVLAKLLAQTPNIEPVVVEDGWPETEETLAAVRCLVFFHDGGDTHSLLKGDRLAKVQKLVDAGVGIVHFHQCVDYPKHPGQRAIHWLGGVWEKGPGKRAHWVAKFDKFPEHAVTRGVTPFEVDDGWLTHLRFLPEKKGIAPLLRTSAPKSPAGSSDKDDAIVSWVYERPDGGRAFAFTGCHLHSSWGIEGYRRFLVNGILWTAKVDVPVGGAPVVLIDDLKSQLPERKVKTKSP